MNADGSALTRIDPRVKFAWLLSTLVCGLAFVDPLRLALVLLSIAVVALGGGILGETIRRLTGLVSIIVVIGLIFGLTVQGAPLVEADVFGFSLAVSRDGLALGLISALRMIVFAAPLMMLVISTSNADLIQGLVALRLPLDYALMIVLALNFVPLYVNEMGRIADAQKARGHALIEQGPIGRLRGFVPIFLPLTLNAVDRADTVGKVLEMRGLARGKWRPEFEPLGRESWGLLGVSVLLLVAVGLAR